MGERWGFVSRFSLLSFIKKKKSKVMTSSRCLCVYVHISCIAT